MNIINQIIRVANLTMHNAIHVTKEGFCIRDPDTEHLGNRISSKRSTYMYADCPRLIRQLHSAVLSEDECKKE